MDDVMEDNASLNRRSKLPTRIAPDRPHGQGRQIPWGTIRKQDNAKTRLKEQQTARTIKRYTDHTGNGKNNIS